MIKVKCLKAGNGDSFLISFDDLEGLKRNILIDGGVGATYYDPAINSYGELKQNIDEIKRNGEKIDLLVLTHIDNDHICGLLRWFELDDEAHKIISNIWFNSGKVIAEYLKKPENNDLVVNIKIFKTPHTGVNESINFENYLVDKGIWDQKIILKGHCLKFNDEIKIEVLSPSEKHLKRLLKLYRKETGNIAYTGSNAKDWNIDLKSFIHEEKSSEFKFKEDSSPKNGSSISFILTIHDKKFLFLGDSHPKGIVRSLQELGFTEKAPLAVEFLKLSHHGSKKNTSRELIKLVKTNHYIVSTDGQVHSHPDKRTLSRIVDINEKSVFLFNYDFIRKSIMNDIDFEDFTNFSVKDVSILEY